MNTTAVKEFERHEVEGICWVYQDRALRPSLFLDSYTMYDSIATSDAANTSGPVDLNYWVVSYVHSPEFWIVKGSDSAGEERKIAGPFGTLLAAELAACMLLHSGIEADSWFND